MADFNSDRLAVLIDADNAQPSVGAELMAEIGRYGTATVKRAYGDWTTSNLIGWKEHLHTLAIQPIQQFRLTAGKN
ncbi:MAG: NYN domain-containing protein, partial [Planctomycetales bacterium]|nr:NYN domain-containing protein [Planctomycetales bacterium]